jgi:hypothetical protein
MAVARLTAPSPGTREEVVQGRLGLICSAMVSVLARSPRPGLAPWRVRRRPGIRQGSAVMLGHAIVPQLPDGLGDDAPVIGIVSFSG